MQGEHHANFLSKYKFSGADSEFFEDELINTENLDIELPDIPEMNDTEESSFDITFLGTSASDSSVYRNGMYAYVLVDSRNCDYC